VGANEDLEAAASLFDRAGDELELAARHVRTAAGHMRDGEVPRGAAHAWAAHGQVLRAGALLDDQARVHAQKSNPEPR
jgi:hypothetical protein